MAANHTHSFRINRPLAPVALAIALGIGTSLPAHAALEDPVESTCGSVPCTFVVNGHMFMLVNIIGPFQQIVLLTKKQKNKYLDPSIQNNLIQSLVTNTDGNLENNADGDTGLAASAAPERMNVWAQGGQSNTSLTYAPLRSSGKSDYYALGVDYMFAPRAVGGVMLMQTAQRITNQYNNNGTMDTDSTTLAGYVSYPLGDALSVNGAIGYTNASMAIVDRTTVATPVRGTRKIDGYFATVGSDYLVRSGDLSLITGVSLGTAVSNYGAVTLSSGAAAASASSSYTEASVGVDARYHANGFTPVFGVRYIANLDQPKQAALQGVAASNDPNYLQLTAGLEWKSQGRLFGSLTYSKDIEHQDINNESIQFKLGLQF
jgi:hypothetical protein